MKAMPFVLLSVVAGMIVPLQIALVSAFRHAGEASQFQATLYLYVGGLLGAVALCLWADGSVVPPSVRETSWWMWLPGLLGVCHLAMMFVAAPHIGAANTLVWIFLGQVLFAVFLDRAGLFNMPVRPVSVLKLAGIALIVVGAILMMWGERKG